MEFIFPLIILAIVAFLTVYLRRQGVTALPQVIRKKVEPAKDWDEEYLRTEAAKHTLAGIDPTRYRYKRDEPGIWREGGYRFRCTCGHKETRPSLRGAEIGFDGHVKAMREVALAQLGRFK